MENWIGKLLYMANSKPYNTSVFYPLKAKILKKYGKHTGTDYQHIVKKCWYCGGTGYYLPGVLCYRCVNGIYESKWWTLEKYKIGEYSFHVPHKTPTLLKNIPLHGPGNIIQGYIRHEQHKYYKEAYYILLFLFDIKKFLLVIWRSLCWKIKCLKYKLVNRGKSDWDIPF